MKRRIVTTLIAVMMVLPVIDAAASPRGKAAQWVRKARMARTSAARYRNHNSSNGKYYSMGERYYKRAERSYKSRSYSSAESNAKKAIGYFKKVDRNAKVENSSFTSKPSRDSGPTYAQANRAINRAQEAKSDAYGKYNGRKYYTKGLRLLIRAKDYRKKRDYGKAINYANQATSMFRRVR